MSREWAKIHAKIRERLLTAIARLVTWPFRRRRAITHDGLRRRVAKKIDAGVLSPYGREYRAWIDHERRRIQGGE